MTVVIMNCRDYDSVGSDSRNASVQPAILSCLKNKTKANKQTKTILPRQQGVREKHGMG